MPSPKYIKKDYAVIREDNTFVVYTLTNADYTELGESLACDAKFAELSVGLLGLKDIRAVIEQKPEKKTEKKEVKPLESGLPDMDIQGLEWLKEQKRQMEEWYASQYDVDSDLDGGRFS
jgi:hypothetical protein